MNYLCEENYSLRRFRETECGTVSRYILNNDVIRNSSSHGPN